MKNGKRVLSILLSVIMVLGVCAVAPVTVNAADDGIVWKDAEQRYEISNYAKSGFECRHNIGYWTREDYIGVGLGAASLIDGVRYSNEREMDPYLTHCGSLGSYTDPENDSPMWESSIKLTEKDTLFKELYKGIYSE